MTLSPLLFAQTDWLSMFYSSSNYPIHIGFLKHFFMVIVLGVNRPSDVSSASHHVQTRSARYAGEAEREPGHNIEVYINDVIFTVIESGQ